MSLPDPSMDPPGLSLMDLARGLTVKSLGLSLNHSVLVTVAYVRRSAGAVSLVERKAHVSSRKEQGGKQPLNR